MEVPALWLRRRCYLNQAFTVSILHIPGKLNIAADVHSRQMYNVASAWLHDETFFTPLLRNFYDEEPKDPEVIKLIDEEDSRPATPPEKLPKTHLFMHHAFGIQIVIPKSMVQQILLFMCSMILLCLRVILAKSICARQLSSGIGGKALTMI